MSNGTSILLAIQYLLMNLPIIAPNMANGTINCLLTDLLAFLLFIEILSINSANKAATANEIAVSTANVKIIFNIAVSL